MLCNAWVFLSSFAVQLVQGQFETEVCAQHAGQRMPTPLMAGSDTSDCSAIFLQSRVDLTRNGEMEIGWGEGGGVPALVTSDAVSHASICGRVAKSVCVDGWKQLCPKVLIIGTNHAASTTLSDTLMEHPALSFGEMKEHRFFMKGTVGGYLDPNKTIRRPHWSDNEIVSVQEYVDQFRVPCNIEKTFDASPQTVFIGNPQMSIISQFRRKPGLEAVEDVRDMLGSDVKMIMTIRDPVDWIFSMNESVSASTNLYVDGRFDPSALQLMCLADSLEAWLQIFPADQFLFICFEDMVLNEIAVMQRVFDFIDMPPVRKSKSRIVAGRRRNTATIPTEARIRYHWSQKGQDCRNRLEHLTGLKCRWACTDEQRCD
eukprot:TRINITY_DN5338_c0_g1_i1.p1 TRINITY_DN5338_c0_g1~~TRINITY_DN5338_c0_g1_i1.p1  ORF type:complete len:372 (+),score=35.02 TRINITY_DN5338_c0_g1_i1:79-1194(+)